LKQTEGVTKNRQSNLETMATLGPQILVKCCLKQTEGVTKNRQFNLETLATLGPQILVKCC
jgi:hypothetical protein